jgi:cytochrome o ubiquinol oxidase subunit 2
MINCKLLMFTRPLSFAIATAALLGGCAHGVLDPHGPVGVNEKLILFDATAIMLAVVIPVILATLGFAWWFRARNPKAHRRPDWEYSGQVEFVTWGIPALIVLFLSGIAWIGSHDLDPPQPLAGSAPPIEIDVISLDWKWLFIYPHEQVATINQLVLPVNTPVHFKLTSAGVMNSFFIPQLGSQIYTMAGMTTDLNLLASDPGTYRGISAQFSGDGFSDMHFEVHAVSSDQYASWLTTTQRGHDELDVAQYAQLVTPSQHDAPRTYARVTPGLFDAVVGNHGAPPSVTASTGAGSGAAR